jgi:hypothetical protein
VGAEEAVVKDNPNWKLRDKRLLAEEQKGRQIVVLAQKVLDHWKYRGWFSEGSFAARFDRLRDFITVQYYTGRRRFKPFSVTPKGVVRHPVPTDQSIADHVYVSSRSCPYTGCVIYTIRAVHDDRPEERLIFVLDPLEG